MKKLVEITIHSRNKQSAKEIFKEKHRYRMPDCWTSVEFEKLWAGFLSGKKIKVMAKEIGRSVAAVNKFLSRSGIRKLAPERKRKAESVFYKAQKKHVLIQAATKTIEKKYTAFTDIIKYIVSKGHTVRKNRDFGSMFYKNEEYFLDEKPMSKTKILILANKLRVEENKPIFKVMDLTW
ncbi:MAG: hypothetical protein LBE97_01100 [Holosporales bacterium]|jgi:hypothetical protein|nr:hypothetical protein [Holosporales bacterium]